MIPFQPTVNIWACQDPLGLGVAGKAWEATKSGKQPVAVKVVKRTSSAAQAAKKRNPVLKYLSGRGDCVCRHRIVALRKVASVVGFPRSGDLVDHFF